MLQPLLITLIKSDFVKLPGSRMTRLGDCLLWAFKKNTKDSFLGYFLHGLVYALILTKKMVGVDFGRFFLPPHPVTLAGRRSK
jgi:hypothetical protein